PGLLSAQTNFTAGNLVIYQVGDGSTGLVNTGNPVLLSEFTQGGTASGFSLALPTLASGGNNQLIASGVATSEGMLTLSGDTRFLTLSGYARNLGGTGSLAGTAAATVPRV